MKTRWIIVVMVLAVMLCLDTAPAQTQVAVIANDSVPADSITRGELLDMYSGDIQRWSNGLPVVLTDLKERGEVRDTFFAFLGKPPSRMKSLWLKRMLSGDGDPPQTLDSEHDMLHKV
ncbi:MAG: hypothetical protein GF341_04735, partial [candidate division Zixibacteria bacterium]|nr:hypothetical protein [candidate division Zixibacteria bacterium]